MSETGSTALAIQLADRTKQLADLQDEYDSTSECVRQVYGELTEGRFTKANVYPKHVIDRVHELEDKRVEEEVEHATGALRTALEAQEAFYEHTADCVTEGCLRCDRMEGDAASLRKQALAGQGEGDHE